MKQTPGTQLRHLIELLDGAVGAAYEDAGLRYRPRFTPVVRALMHQEPLTVGQIAASAGLTQPAATQTVALMIREGIASAQAGPADSRQRLVRLTKQGREMLPELQVCWRATSAAASSLEAELPFPLTEVLDRAIQALGRKSFGERIREARAEYSEASKQGRSESGKSMTEPP